MAAANPNRLKNLDVNLGSNAQEASYELATAELALWQAIRQIVRHLPVGDNDITQARKNAFNTVYDKYTNILAQTQTVFDSTRKKTGTAQKAVLCTPLPNYDEVDPADQNRKLRRQTNVPNQRDVKISMMTGDTQEPIECRMILRRVIDEADNRNLDEQTTIKFLKQYTSKAVYATICTLQDAGAGLEGIVRQLETQYCGLMEPDAAKKELQAVRRRRGETLIQFGQRIDDFAYLACRLDPDARKQQLLLAQKVFVDCLEPSLRLDINAIIRQREIGGFMELSQFELFSQANKLEIERGIAIGNGSPAPHLVCRVEEESDEDEEIHDFECNRVFYGAGPRRNKQNRKQPFRTKPKFNKQTANVFAISDMPSQEPFINDEEEDILAEAGIAYDSNQEELLVPTDDTGTVLRVSAKTLNVGPDQCLRCGLKNHRCFSKQCPLKNQPIMPRPCTKCHQGGHMAKWCPRRNSKN